MPTKKLPPVHPGEILQEEFLEPLGLTQYRLAKDLSVPPRRNLGLSLTSVQPLDLPRHICVHPSLQALTLAPALYTD